MRTSALLASIVLAAGCGGGAKEPPGTIVYTVSRGGFGEIWAMDATGGNRVRLTEARPSETTNTDWDQEPDWR